MTSQSKGRALKALLEEIQRAAQGRPMQWIVLHDVATRLGFDDEVVEAAVRVAVDRGLLLAEGEPPQKVCLRTDMQELT